MISTRLALLLHIAIAAGASCRAPNSLEGSIGDSHDLRFDTVEARLFTDQLTFMLRYEQFANIPFGEGGGTLTACSVQFSLPQSGLEVGSDLDVLPLDGSVSNIMLPENPFPAVDSLVFNFAEVAVEDSERTVGNFRGTFIGGQTINGLFDTPLIHVDPPVIDRELD